MEAGPMKDLVNKFGQQMLSGQFDGKELAGLMGKVDGLERGGAAQMLSQVNQELQDNGVSIRATQKDGKIESLEMKSADGKISVRVDQNGNVSARNDLVSTGESPEQISLRLAKKVEADACPLKRLALLEPCAPKFSRICKNGRYRHRPYEDIT